MRYDFFNKPNTSAGLAKLLPMALLLGCSVAPVLAQDINNTTWNGWTDRGSSIATGVYARGAKAQDYQVYTAVFEYTTGNPIPGTSSGFENGRRILGIGIRNNSGTTGFPVIKVDPNNNSYIPSPDGTVNGQSSFSGSSDAGDFTVQFPTSGSPSEITIRNAGAYSLSASYYLGSGGNWGGAGQPAMRGINPAAGVWKVFFDLDTMTTEFGPGGTRNTDPAKPKLGAFGTSVTIATGGLGGTEAVVQAALPVRQDVNNTTWDGWTDRGSSIATGVYARGAKANDYQVYTAVFDYTTGNPIPGTSSGFVNGRRILGIGIRNNSGTTGFPVIKVDPNNNSYIPSPDGTVNGQSSFSANSDAGDFTVQFPTSGSPSEITIRNAGAYSLPASYYLPNGGNWGGGGQPAMRGINPAAGVWKVFFDLDTLTTEFGPGGTRNTDPAKPKLGAFGSSITIATGALGGTEAVVEVVIDTAPTVTNNGLATAVGRRELLVSSLLNATDLEQTSAQLTFTVTVPPTLGTLSSNNFTAADLGNSLVSYTNTTSGSADQFTFQVSDGKTTLTDTFPITISTSRIDTDRDGLPNDLEALRGTNASSKDSDGDGIEDGVEIGIGTNPLSAASPGSATDTDGDLIPNAFDASPANADANSDRIRDGYALARRGNVAASVTLGNVNGTGGVDFADGLALLRSFLGLAVIAPDVDQDVNRDGFIDNADGAIIINWFLTNIQLLPFPK
jgi:hypothetical protein